MLAYINYSQLHYAWHGWMLVECWLNGWCIVRAEPFFAYDQPAIWIWNACLMSGTNALHKIQWQIEKVGVLLFTLLSLGCIKHTRSRVVLSSVILDSGTKHTHTNTQCTSSMTNMANVSANRASTFRSRISQTGLFASCGLPNTIYLAMPLSILSPNDRCGVSGVCRSCCETNSF